MTCRNCGAELQNGEKFCSHCGRGLDARPRRCARCGAELRADDCFCSQCGVPAHRKGHTNLSPEGTFVLTPPSEPNEYGFRLGQIAVPRSPGDRPENETSLGSPSPDGTAPPVQAPYPATLRSEHAESPQKINIGLGLAGMILGILALLIAGNFLSPVLGITAVGISGIARSGQQEDISRDFALIGLVLGLAAVFLFLRSRIF